MSDQKPKDRFANQLRKGGKRPGAGRKVYVPRRMLLLFICISEECGVCLGRKILREEPLDTVLTKKQLAQLADWTASPDRAKNLALLESRYRTMRHNQGYAS
jgi:hypothetical protein